MNILLLGDSMLDRYWIGNSTRANPDGPQALVDIDQVVCLPGGAANVKANLESLGGCDVFFAESGTQIVKNRIVSGNRVVLRFDEGSRLEPIITRYDLRAVACLYPWSAVVVSDYAKGSVDDVVAEWVRSLKVPTYVDCKTKPQRWSSWVDCMFPNIVEYQKNSAIYDNCSCALMIKAGSKGCTFRENPATSLKYRTFPSVVRDVVNPAGAGDTAMAAFVVASLTGAPTSEACEFAMAAAAAAVEAPLTYAPSLPEIASKFGNLFAAKQIKAGLA